MSDLRGQLHQYNANQPIELNDPQQVWVVQSGAIAIFVVTIDRDQISGQRQYLCTIDPGEAMFGAIAASHQLLAVPLGTAEVWALDSHCWQDLCHQQDPRIHTWLAGWLGHLAPILATQPLPATAVQADNAAHYSLVDRQTLQVTEMCWVEMQSGTACWQGNTEIPLTDEALPLPATIWLSSIGDVQIATRPLAQISPAALLAGLARFHACLLQSIQLSNECQQQVDRSRLTERDRLNQQLTLSTLETLAGTLPAARQHYQSVGDPLLMAVGAVGRSLGMEIRPPATADRVVLGSDPLAAIVRASRLRKRRVLLRDRW